MKRISLFLPGLLLFLLGCGLLPGRVFEAATGAAAPLETAAARLTEVAVDEAALACAPNARPQTARVTRVIDGDTIEVRLEGQTVRVRYIGVDTPETDERFYEQAARANAALVEGKTVTLLRDVSETDRYGRLLRYVFVEDVFVNYELIRQGYAFASAYPPDVACAASFSEAERLARADAAGLWAGADNAQHCHPSYPTVCIPPSPPDLDCKDVPHKNFVVIGEDPHRFDGDNDGFGCEN